MSSTNVHSNPYLCGGDTRGINPKQGIEIPPKASGRGPSRLAVVEGEKAEIPAWSNISVRDGKKVEARATLNDYSKSLDSLQESDIKDVLVGDMKKIVQAIKKQKEKKVAQPTRKQTERVDMEK